MSVALARPTRWRRHRLRRVLVEGFSALLGAVLVIWSLLPVYNMLLIALDEEGDTEYAGIIWPSEPTLKSFLAIWNEDYWYL